MIDSHSTPGFSDPDYELIPMEAETYYCDCGHECYEGERRQLDGSTLCPDCWNKALCPNCRDERSWGILSGSALCRGCVEGYGHSK